MHNIRSHSRFLQELLVICPGEGVAPFKSLYVFKQTLVRNWASCDTTRIKLGFGGGCRVSGVYHIFTINLERL